MIVDDADATTTDMTAVTAQIVDGKVVVMIAAFVIGDWLKILPISHVILIIIIPFVFVIIMEMKSTVAIMMNV